eukprot:TRINITY_DN9696_c0_g1_i2.p1 TRINITY_DN9696_c0_g1~~TRINITY_DN9696_c0_g1_i2.p1  ORF type:complete len:185 (+),score=29.31 TRINITY_DN9696_c0_g1_i2:350-904(+)
MSGTFGKKRKYSPEETQHRGMIRHLAQDIWCRIGVSKLHGVGVIAIRDIPKGVVVDKVPVDMLPPHLRREVQSEPVHLEELQDVDENVVSYLKEMYVCTDGKMDICKYGANTFVGLSHFVNHSDTPNVEFIESPEPDLGYNMKIITCSEVKKGEELLCDYKEYLTPEELSSLPGMDHIEPSKSE